MLQNELFQDSFSEKWNEKDGKNILQMDVIRNIFHVSVFIFNLLS